LRKTDSELPQSSIQDDLELGDEPRQPVRRLAREMALRAAYVMEFQRCSAAEALHDPLVNDQSKPPAYAFRLLEYSEQHREYLDDLIRSKVEKWEFHRIAMIDRLILRLALVELLFFDDVPPKVTINEAIEVAKRYSTAQSGKFVNGILDAVYSDVIQGRIHQNA